MFTFLGLLECEVSRRYLAALLRFGGIILGLIAIGEAWADVRLPKLISDDMVLQRDAPIKVWGWADPGEELTIEFHDQRISTKTKADGRWLVQVGPFSAGGPFDMAIAGRNKLVLRNVLIGDVWVASGQSNMYFPLMAEGQGFRGVDNVGGEITAADFPDVRLFKVDFRTRAKPADDFANEGWTTATPQTVKSFSAVAFLFGRNLHQRYHVPIGLIEASVGGTLAEAWMSDAGLREFPSFQQKLRELAGFDDITGEESGRRYVELSSDWDKRNGSVDRGRVEDRAIWAAKDFDDSAWPSVDEPQSRPLDLLRGYGGTVWFRKRIQIPAEFAGRCLYIHIGDVIDEDVAYFNGERLGETKGRGRAREYLVPGTLVKAGENSITIRATGDEWTGLYGDPQQCYFQIGAFHGSLAGSWVCQPGPDLSSRPQPSAYAKVAADPNTATVLFNGMIAPLVSYRVRGVIWYQGESNALAGRAREYRTLFPALIRNWRNLWGYDFPFLFVQLAGFGPNLAESADCPWAELREAQNLALTIPKTGMATAVDLGEMWDIHPTNKQEVARRLTLVAERMVYGENVLDSGPTYETSRVDGSQIRIKFSNMGSGFRIEGQYGYINGFQVAGPDLKYSWAQAKQEGDEIVVFSDSVQHPVAVRYDWANTPDGNLYNKEGLPAVPFRTDNPK